MTTQPQFTVWTELKRLWAQLRAQGIGLTLLAGIDKLWRIVTGSPYWRYSRVTPQILLGGQPAVRVLPELAAAGVTGVINLREEYDYASETGPAHLRYLYLPTTDNTAPTLEALQRGADFIREELANGGSVYIHCWEGLGRSPTLIAAYLVSTGLSPADAWAKIRAGRPFIRPVQAQIDQIAAYADYLRAAVPSDAKDQTIAAATDVQIVEPTDKAATSGRE